MLAAAVAGVATAKSVAGEVADFFGSYDKETDAARREGNTRAYNAATAPGGSVNAYRYLKQRSGKFGIATIPPIAGVYDGGQVGGWASPPARADAEAKYKALAPRYETAALPNTTGDTTVTGLDPLTGLPTATRPTAASLAPLMLGLGVLVVLALLARKGS